MPVSESEKLGVSVRGGYFSEKTEHMPIKKRRFLYTASSPPRQETSPRAYKHEVKENPIPTCVSESASGMCEGGGNDDKLVKKELVKAKNEPREDGDFSGISILAAAACSKSLGAEPDRCEGSGIGIGIGIGIAKSPGAPTAVELKENTLKSGKEESDSHTLRKDSSPNESTLDKSSSQLPLESAIPTAKDVRFNWDLNTVMVDGLEEPFVSEHEVSAHNNVTSLKEKKENCTKVNSRDCELGTEWESGIPIPSKDTSNPNIPIELKSLAHENKLKLGNNKPEPFSFELDNAQQYMTAESAIPVTKNLILENQTSGIRSKWAAHGGQTSCGTEAVDTKLSMDCSLPPGFNHCLNLHATKENVMAESAIPVTTQTAMTITCKHEYEEHDLSLTPAAPMENGPHQKHDLSLTPESMVKRELTSDDVSKGTEVELSLQTAAIPSMHDSETLLENGISYDNSQSDNRGGSEYDSQYEDGELRESSMNACKGQENDFAIDNKGDNLNIGITDSHETNLSPCRQHDSPVTKHTETDTTSSVLSPEKLHHTDEASVLTVSEPNDMVSNQSNIESQLNQSDEWKMNVSGLDHLPENQRIPITNFTKTRNFTGRKFSYGEQKDGFDPEDMEMKGEGSRFYRKGTRDVFLSRDRFRVQGSSSSKGGVVRSFGRGRYSPPHARGSVRGGGVWNRSPPYQGPPFPRSMLEDSGSIDSITIEDSMDPNESNRPNTCRPFRSRLPMSREANDFRARLGLRPTGDDHRFNMTRGRGRGRVGYGPRVGNDVPESGPGPGPRRYHGSGSDEFIPEYPNPFPRRRRCFSPVERRGNQYSDSISPSRPRTRSPVSGSSFRCRSRSPSFRRRRVRSPNYRRGFEPEYNSHSNSNSGLRNGNPSPPPPNPRWVNYKERPSAVFDRRSSPPPPQLERERERERFSYYERKPKQIYRSGQPGRFDPSESGRGRPRYVGKDDGNGSETDRLNGYRRGGFVRRYNNMDGHVKRFSYDDEDGFGKGVDSDRSQKPYSLLSI